MNMENTTKYDVIVLGAGIVGTSAAVHLQQCGLQVALLDKKEPGEGTSFGNAGLIERSSVIPYAFPRSISSLLGYALNRRSDVRYDYRYLPVMASWLYQFWKNSAPKPLAQAAHDMLPLVERSVIEHDILIQKSGAQSLIRDRGWMDIYTQPSLFLKAKKELSQLAPYHLDIAVLEGTSLKKQEPYLSDKVVGAIHFRDPKTVLDPAELTKRYAALFEQLGGQSISGEIVRLEQTSEDWKVVTKEATYHAKQVVVALGADSAALIAPFGYKVPLAIKRGYHVHFEVQDDVTLGHSVCESDAGFVLAPMNKGIRLTTGIEFAPDGSPVNETQIRQAEAIARTLFPLGDRIEETPWLGRRPCLPDMRPVIGAAPDHKGLWFDFGHAHHGLTLGPVSGKLLAQMMTHETPFTDPSPYRIERFL